MRHPVTLLHITDLHLCTDPHARLHGWQVDAAFRCVLDAALTRYPDCDALILGGDLVDDGSEAGYRRLNRMLLATGKPVLAMAGNHDDPQRMARTLPAATVHGTLPIAGWRLVALDSHVPGHEHGHIGAYQLDALAETLAGSDTPTLVCVHHPPLSLASRWLDAISLFDADDFNACITQHACVRGVLCGHAHQAHTGAVGSVPCWISPATMRQFAAGAAQFAEDTGRSPGYRALELAADGSIATTVWRVPAARRFGCG